MRDQRTAVDASEIRSKRHAKSQFCPCLFQTKQHVDPLHPFLSHRHVGPYVIFDLRPAPGTFIASVQSWWTPRPRTIEPPVLRCLRVNDRPHPERSGRGGRRRQRISARTLLSGPGTRCGARAGTRVRRRRRRSPRRRRRSRRCAPRARGTCARSRSSSCCSTAASYRARARSQWPRPRPGTLVLARLRIGNHALHAVDQKRNRPGHRSSKSRPSSAHPNSYS